MRVLTRFLSDEGADHLRFTAYFHDGEDNVCEMLNSGMIDVYDILEEDVHANGSTTTRDVVLDFGSDVSFLLVTLW